jgi:hypothetical protein
VLTALSPARAAPAVTTAPYSVALACNYQVVAEYRPDNNKIDREIEHGSLDAITSIAYDSSGNLYVAVETLTKDWVDEYPPGSTTVSRHIEDGIKHPVAMAADPAGDLYVGNAGFGPDRYLVMYKPGSTSPDVIVYHRAYGLVWANIPDNNLLWASLSDSVVAFDGKESRYSVRSNDSRQLSETGGNLYVLEQPPIFADYVKEYGIAGGKPVFARTIDADLYYIKAITTDKNENLFLAEWNFSNAKFNVTEYNREGVRQFSIDGITKPVSLVASPTSFYVAEGEFNGSVYRYEGMTRRGTLDRPKHCATPTALAIMEPPK